MEGIEDEPYPRITVDKETLDFFASVITESINLI